MAKKVHGYKNDKEYDENPVLSNPFHNSTLVSLEGNYR
jgi:hypothetical protein